MTDPAQQGAADTSARVTVTPEAFDPSERVSTTHMRSLTPHGTERVIVRAPWYVTISAAVVDCVIGGGLLLLLNGEKLKSQWSQGIALAILGGIAGVRVADYVRALVKGVNPTGAGPALVLFALLSQVGPHVAAAVRVLLAGAGVALVVVGLSNCGGPLVKEPAGQMAARVAWPSVHRGAESAGLCSDCPPEWLVGPGGCAPMDGGVADASAAAPGDASSAAGSDGGAP